MSWLDRKTVAIIGASGGIGQAAAKTLAAHNARLVLGGTRDEALEALSAELDGDGNDVIHRRVDVTSEHEVRSFFEHAERSFGRLDALVNLAGVSIPSPVADMSEEQYDRTLDINLKGSFLCAKYFVHHSDAAAGGKIIHVGSMAAKRANANAPMYCTAKAAVNMFSQGLALQLIEKNIRVTTLNPGATDTAFWGERQVPKEKFMTPQDVADVLLFVLQADPRIVIHEINFESFAFFK
jgi:NAD(P)-dependent dehydrogenase (short-subunit alcohol dehydrogenase family)